MIEEVIARQLQLPLRHVQGAVRLLREGATVPFISRYRKEATGSMDEVQVGAVKEALERLTALEARRATVLETIGGQGRLTDELRRIQKDEKTSAAQRAVRAREIARRDTETLLKKTDAKPQPIKEFVPLKEVQIGQEVVIADLGQTATVTARPDRNGMVEPAS